MALHIPASGGLLLHSPSSGEGLGLAAPTGVSDSDAFLLFLFYFIILYFMHSALMHGGLAAQL